MAQVTLLGTDLPIVVEPGAEDDEAEVTPVIQAAAAVLNGQFADGRLPDRVVDYVRALRGLGVGAGRSFTPCAGTADVEDGEYVYFIGVQDVRVNPDPLWYCSTIIHDGGHAWLSQQGRPATGVEVEQALTQVQIDYYETLGERPSYVQNLIAYRDDPAAIQARILTKV